MSLSSGRERAEPVRSDWAAFLGRRIVTVMRLLAHFANAQRFFLLPLVAVLLLAGVLLLVTGGLSYVAPFVYTLF